MRMKKSVLVSLLLACLPLFVMAQSNDDLYFIPKKKTEKKVTSGTPAKVVIEKDKNKINEYEYEKVCFNVVNDGMSAFPCHGAKQ